ncbi:MAG: hypothetical protein Q9200_003559 [Gallowayella weberi]
MFGAAFSRILSGETFLSYKGNKPYSQVMSEDGSDDEKNTLNCELPPTPPQWLQTRGSSMRHTEFLAVSALLNVVLIGLVTVLWMFPPPEVSHWAKLSRDTPRPLLTRTPYSSTSLEEASKLWETSLNIDTGMLALTDDFVKKQGLPTVAGRFPWDPDKKSLFFVSGFHDLHCLRTIHMSITESNLHLNQTYALNHITHCLDALRDSVICHADDTPLFTFYADQKDLPTQTRKCRSWAKLSQWAAQPSHTACYRYLSEQARQLDQHERFKFCTRETGYADVVNGWFRRAMGREVPDYYPQVTGADEI